MDVIEDKTKELVGDNPITAEMGNEHDENDRRGVWWSIQRLTSAAGELYSDASLSFDAAAENLTKAILKLKGKEKELLKALNADKIKEGPEEVEEKVEEE